MSLSWRERLSEGRIVPHYQPIISVETGEVFGYEALGRHVIGPEVRSLGPFFQASAEDPTLAELHRDVDRSLRRVALTEFAAADPETLLFLNVTPRLMVEHLALRPEELPWTLRVMDEVGMDPRRVVIELTEEAVGSRTASLRRLVDLYRARGCAIAVDDVGAEASNLDRIGYFEPDIIKIDAVMLRRSIQERSFRQVLRGLGTMAEGLGASLLFEGVETEEELQQALGFGARFLQGWLFAKAGPTLVSPGSFSAGFRPALEQFGRARGTEAALRSRRIDEVMGVLGGTDPRAKSENGRLILDSGAMEPWGLVACRVFVTDLVGFQVSGNYEREGGQWAATTQGLGRCRSFRPYFSGPHGIGHRPWSVSPTYYDLNDRSLLRTYGRPLGAGHLLFVDVPEIENQT